MRAVKLGFNKQAGTFYNMIKEFKGDKYIYYLMAYKLCLLSKNKDVIIGNDNWIH